jgi:putative transposase
LIAGRVCSRREISLGALQRACQEASAVPSHCFSEIFLHLNWHCQNDQPMLLGDIAQKVDEYLRLSCQNTAGVRLHGLGGTADHIHLLLEMEPDVQISALVGALKGGCSHEINHASRSKLLLWQRGYGVVSFARRNLPGLQRYVANQKAHHAAGTVRPKLEIADRLEECSR